MNDFPNHDPQTGKWRGTETKSLWQKGFNDGYAHKKDYKFYSEDAYPGPENRGYMNGWKQGTLKSAKGL